MYILPEQPPPLHEATVSEVPWHPNPVHCLDLDFKQSLSQVDHGDQLDHSPLAVEQSPFLHEVDMKSNP